MIQVLRLLALVMWIRVKLSITLCAIAITRLLARFFCWWCGVPWERFLEDVERNRIHRAWMRRDRGVE